MRVGTPKQARLSACVNSSAPLIDSPPLKTQLLTYLVLILIILPRSS